MRPERSCHVYCASPNELEFINVAMSPSTHRPAAVDDTVGDASSTDEQLGKRQLTM